MNFDRLEKLIKCNVSQLNAMGKKCDPVHWGMLFTKHGRLEYTTSNRAHPFSPSLVGKSIQYLYDPEEGCCLKVIHRAFASISKIPYQDIREFEYGLYNQGSVYPNSKYFTLGIKLKKELGLPQ